MIQLILRTCFLEYYQYVYLTYIYIYIYIQLLLITQLYNHIIVQTKIPF